MPFIDDFVFLLSQREELSVALKADDERFLQLTRQQYYNHPFIDKSMLPLLQGALKY